MPKHPMVIKKTEFKNYEEHDRYMEGIKKRTSMSGIRNTRDNMNARSNPGIPRSHVQALNYMNDQQRKNRRK